MGQEINFGLELFIQLSITDLGITSFHVSVLNIATLATMVPTPLHKKELEYFSLLNA